LLLALSIQSACCQVSDTYENAGFYNGPSNPIVAVNFINDDGAVFNIDFPAVTGTSLLTELFDGWSNVENYTNNGTMNCNTGFRFDTQTTGHVGAMNFNNAGFINCGLDPDAIALFQYYLFTESTFYAFGGIYGFFGNVGLVGNGGFGTFYTGHGYGSLYAFGGVYVLATNVVNSGSILSGYSSFMNIRGNSVDLTYGNVGMTTNFYTGLFGVGQPAYGKYEDIGLNTNFWDVTADLTPNFAITSLPFGRLVFGSTPYINITTNYLGTNTLIQAVFLLNEQSNTTATVNFQTDGFGNDFAYIQWAGSYFNPATGLESSNYLELIDDYTLAISTNVLLTLNNVPDNFVFESQVGTPYLTTSYPSGFPAGFTFLPTTGVTNRYSDVIAELEPTTVGTNLVPGGALTNIAGRVQISASGTLNISSAIISGMNYLNLTATNQLVNDGQAQISAPYSDLYLGSTNGNLVMTNVLVSSVPKWNGTVTAWSSGWQAPNATGATNYYEVLVVDSTLNPIFQAQQQDVILYASNNLVISDLLGVMRNFYTTATNLLITTNIPGNGSYALDGELNVAPPGFSWASATPNLRTLTNNGAIRTANLTAFGSAAIPYLSFVNNGLISNAFGAKIFTGDFENSGNFIAGNVLLGNGQFNLQASGTALFTNGTISAGATMSLAANTLILSNQNLTAGDGITLSAVKLLTDTGVTNGNNWTLGSAYGGFGNLPGFSLLSKPVSGDLLGTTIDAISPGGRLVNTWAGIDYGLSNQGFTNNEAIGRLILDSTTNSGHYGKFNFTGVGISNAIYIDYLEFADTATNGVNNSYDFTNFVTIDTNMVVYFAQAVALGTSIAEKLDKASRAGANGGRLRWIPTYSGYFSGTNLVSPNGTTNFVNVALAQSTLIDSDGNGIVNANDPNPFYTASEVDLNVQVTNAPTLETLISWHSIPASTNFVYYTTDIGGTNWSVLTNFVSPATVPPVGGWPITNLVADPVNLVQPHYYKVGVTPNNQLLYGH